MLLLLEPLALKQIAISGLIPAAIVAVVLLATGKLAPRWQAFSAAAALAAAFLFTYAMVTPPPYWPVTEASGWIPIFVVPAILLVWLQPFAKVHWYIKAVATIGFLSLYMWRMFVPPLDRSAYLWAEALWVWSGLLLIVSSEDGPIRASFRLTLLSLASAAVIFIAGSMKLAQYGGPLVAAFGVIFLAAWLLKRRFSLAPAAAVAAVILGGLWLNAYFFANLKWPSLLLLALAPLPGLFAKGPVGPAPSPGNSDRLTGGGAGPTIVWLIASHALTILLLIGAVVLAIKASPPLDYGY